MKRSRPDSSRRQAIRFDASIENAAADWVSRRDMGLQPEEAVEFENWMAADPRRRAAVADLEATWAAMNRPREAGRSAAIARNIAGLKQAAVRRRRRVWRLTGGAALAAAAVLMMVFRFAPELLESAWTSTPAPTVVLRPDRQALPDGSFVELNSGAQIDVEFSAQRRGVRLVRGDALFFVAKDATRPFVVSAGDVTVRAVGTAFAVHFNSTQVDVLVTEGQVAVERAPVPDAHAAASESSAATGGARSEISAPVLTAGHRLVIPVVDRRAPEMPVEVLSPIELSDALAWRQRRVEFSSTTLAEAVLLFNRGNPVQLALGDSATAALRISGVFWTDDPEGFSRLLQSSLGVGAQRASENQIVLQKQAGR